MSAFAAKRRHAELTAACLACAAASLLGASIATAAAPVNTVSPQISGKPRVGQTLSANQGEWQGSPTSFFYQWLRCDATGDNCAPVAGAVDPQYLLTEADLGARIRVDVTAVNGDGSSPARRSAATAVIKVPVPTVTAKPTISGTPRQGQTLSATTGTWTGSPTSFEYQWKRCANSQCVSIPGATAASYLLGASEVGTRVRVRVRARNDGGLSAAAQSSSTSTVSSATAGLELGPPKHDRKRGLARFRVKVPSAGLLTLVRTANVRGEQRRAAGARMLKLTVKPRGQARRRLDRRGKAKVQVRVRFAADVGGVVERRRLITLRG